jgi:hypothetical protein
MPRRRTATHQWPVRHHGGYTIAVITPFRKARRALLCGLLLVTSCRASDDNMPRQSRAAVEALFGDVLQGCGAPLTTDGTFDQGAMVAAGWQERERTTRFEAANQTHPPGSRPSLRPGEYEATVWALPGRVGVVEVIRQDAATRQQTADMCSVAARLEREVSLDTIVTAISTRLGQAVAREGDLPRGGDFLTPRADRAPHAYYWKTPQHDVYLVAHGTSDVRLEVYAIADRTKLDEYSPDRPERRIPQATVRP